MKYSVPDMNCGHCKAAVEGALHALEPGAAVAVDLPARTVDFDGSSTPGAVVAALAAVGFPSEPRTD